MPTPVLARRALLRGAGVAIALPWLPSLRRATARESVEASPRRMVCIGNEFGMYPGAFWPQQAGADYELTPLLRPLAERRGDFSLFSHLDHGLKGGHFAVHTYLTGVKAAEAKGLPEGGISLDQKAAEWVGSQTRFPSLTIGSENGLHGGCRMSWTRNGVRVPPIEGPRELFRLLFVEDDPESRRRQTERISLQESILDSVLAEARSLQRRLNRDDRRKLEEYFSSVRDVETKLELDRHWQHVPKPRPSLPEPRDQGLARDLPAIYDLIALALQTDSTRVATLEIGGGFAASDLGIRQGYHALSHHGQLPDKIDLLVRIETYQMEQFARFLNKLHELRDPETGLRLLDQTMVLHGSGMGNANSHTNHDLPVLLAGGGFKHGRHLVLPREPQQRVPLCNLYLSMLQQFGLETDEFSVSTGTLTALEQA